MAYQDNDTVIVFKDVSGVGVENAVEIIYKLFTSKKDQEILTKTKTGNGISIENIENYQSIVVALSDEETAPLQGQYYQEIKIQSIDGDVFTLFQGGIIFKKTYIREI